MSFLNSGGAQDNEDLDEDGIADAHQKAYSQQDTSAMPPKSLGAAAAMQALKQFTSSGATPGETHQQQSSGGGLQTKLISMAMAEAAKLFDQNGGAGNGGQKQDVVNSAGQAMMKLMIKNQVSGMMGGGASSMAGSSGAAGSGGGMSQMFNMAQAFMK